MPLERFRRPSALLAFAYVLSLFLLDGRGAFRPRPHPAWMPLLGEGPLLLEGRLLSGVLENRRGLRVRFSAERIVALRGHAPLLDPAPRRPAELWAYLPKTEAARGLAPGQRVALEGSLRLPRWPRNPGDFDERRVCFLEGITFILHAARLEMLDPTVPWSWRPRAWADSVRNSIHAMARRVHPGDPGAILEGMLIGAKRPMAPAMERAVRDAGVVHLLVASGTNADLVLWFTLWVCFKAGLCRPRAQAAAVLACGFYGLVVGAEAPYLRAYFCLMLTVLARVLGRPPDPFQFWLLSGLAILSASPRSLFLPGFQLSYMAVLALILAWRRWRAAEHWSGPARALFRILLASLAVQVVLAPLLARIFGRISVSGILANAVLVPASGVIFVSGFAAWLCSLLPVPWLFDLAAPVLRWLLEGFRRTCVAFASLPMSAVDAPRFGVAETSAYYAALAGFMCLPRRRFACGAWALSGTLLLGRAVAAKTSEPELRLVFFSQQGRRSALACLPDGSRYLVDGGLSPATALRSLKAMGVDRLDGIFVLSADPAAWRGLELARRMPVGALWLLIDGSLPKKLQGVMEGLRRGGLRSGNRQEHARGRGIAAGPGLLGLSHGGFQVRFDRFGTACGALAGSRGFCVRSAPARAPGPASGLPPSPPVFDTFRDGAVYVTLRGGRLEVRTQREDVFRRRAKHFP